MPPISNNSKRIFLAAVITVAALLAIGIAPAQTADDSLARGFQDPPDSAKPRVWWHWMSGNVTKEGIKADLEWMKRVGIAGFQNFDAGLNTPQIVEKRLVYMTPEWKDAFKYAATLADQLGLEMAIAGSPGWSESGGPWVTPAQAMKKYVWSETRVEGGRPFSGALPKPPAATGPYQNQPGRHRRLPRRQPGRAARILCRRAVVAYRASGGDRTVVELGAKVTSSGGTFDVAALTDGDLAKAALLPAAPAGERAWIQFEFAPAQTIRGLTIRDRRRTIGRGTAGESGIGVERRRPRFRTVAPIPAGARTIAFAPCQRKVLPPQRSAPPSPRPGGARAVRLRLRGQPASPERRSPSSSCTLRRSSTGSRKRRPSRRPPASTTWPRLPFRRPTAVRKADVIDLTSKMRPDGTLDWTPPAGSWVVLRFGYSLTGARKPPRVARGHRTRSGQAEPSSRQGVLRQLPRPV